MDLKTVEMGGTVLSLKDLSWSAGLFRTIEGNDCKQLSRLLV